MGVRRSGVALLLSGAVLLGACSGGDESATKAAETATESTDEALGFCEQFSELAAQREQQGGGGVQPGSDEAAPDDEAAWERRIETTTLLAEAAPADHQAEGQTYVELVEARAALFAEHGYPSSISEIPADAVQAFINDHKDEQQVVNAFIDFAKTECGVG